MSRIWTYAFSVDTIQHTRDWNIIRRLTNIKFWLRNQTYLTFAFIAESAAVWNFRAYLYFCLAGTGGKCAVENIVLFGLLLPSRHRTHIGNLDGSCRRSCGSERLWHLLGPH